MQIILFSSGKPDGRAPAASLSRNVPTSANGTSAPHPCLPGEAAHPSALQAVFPASDFALHRRDPAGRPGHLRRGGRQGSSHPARASRRDVRVLNQAIRPRLLPSAWRAERHLRHPAFLRSLADAGFLSASCAGTPAAIKYAGTGTKNFPETVPIVFSGSIAAQRYEYFTFFHYIGIVMYNI